MGSHFIALSKDDNEHDIVRRIGVNEMADRKSNPVLFARPADGDGLSLVQRGRALRRKACWACARPPSSVTSKQTAAWFIPGSWITQNT
jgi:hypothetical protein